MKLYRSKFTNFKMSHVRVETAEEDAADLQFPKGEKNLIIIVQTSNYFQI